MLPNWAVTFLPSTSFNTAGGYLLLGILSSLRLCDTGLSGVFSYLSAHPPQSPSQCSPSLLRSWMLPFSMDMVLDFTFPLHSHSCPRLYSQFTYWKLQIQVFSLNFPIPTWHLFQDESEHSKLTAKTKLSISFPPHSPKCPLLMIPTLVNGIHTDAVAQVRCLDFTLDFFSFS